MREGEACVEQNSQCGVWYTTTVGMYVHLDLCKAGRMGTVTTACRQQRTGKSADIHLHQRKDGACDRALNKSVHVWFVLIAGTLSFSVQTGLVGL